MITSMPFNLRSLAYHPVVEARIGKDRDKSHRSRAFRLVIHDDVDFAKHTLGPLFIGFLGPIRQLLNAAQGSNLIVLDAEIVDPRIGAWTKGYGIGHIEFGMAEELPGTVENYKGRDPAAHRSVSRMV